MLAPACSLRWTWTSPKIKVKGRFGYRDSLISPNGTTPMRNIIVELWDDDGPPGPDTTYDDTLAHSTTDANGYFTFPCVKNVDEDADGGLLDLYVRAYYRSDSTAFPFRVVPVTIRKQDDGVYTLDTAPVVNAQGEPDHSIYDVGTQKPATTDYERNTAMHLYTVMFRGWDWVNARINTTNPDSAMMGATIHWAWEWDQQQSYQLYGDIYVQGHGHAETAEPDEWDDPILLHEYGHLVAYRFHFKAADSGPHDHTGQAACAADSLAWNEGWASFFGCATKAVNNADPTIKNVGWDVNDTARKYWTFNHEDGWYRTYTPKTVPPYLDSLTSSARYNDQGALWEWPVAGALWDLYDNIRDNQPPVTPLSCADTLIEDAGHTYSFAACRTYMPHPTTALLFYDAYRAQHGDSTTLARLGPLFCEHGIDVSGRGQFAARARPQSVLGAANMQCLGNPVQEEMRIVLTLQRAKRVTLSIHDVQGRLVRQVVDGVEVPAGSRSFAWKRDDGAGARVGPGVYFVRFQSGNLQQVEKIVVLQ